jgi:hypothetical protein
VIAVAPFLDEDTPFPTAFWLTCPLLAREVSVLESAGEHLEWAARGASDADLRGAMLMADAAYRAARTVEGSGVDPCADVGTAGQRDPLQVKCLHARVAAACAGVPDPIGSALLARLDRALGTCDGGRCEAEGVGAER